ncbi:MAG: DUF1684 domain-containing protein [Bacteroidetes Order II. Incertae sedis bacterium]|nr:DUF1684 domain-containing protein [Bacteroidetes Order II. bacterium]
MLYRIRKTLRLVHWVALSLLVVGCEKQLSAYEQAILQNRFEKDSALRNPKTRVLRPQDIPNFKGLKYFEVNSAYRFVVPLLPTENNRVVRMKERITEKEREYKCAGVVALKFPEGEQRLLVFKLEEEPPDIYWIPFRDATSGKETYGGGRYLSARKISGNSLVVDFNEAYNPYCDYNPDYICTLPPAENKLSIPVSAGEKQSRIIAHE